MTVSQLILNLKARIEKNPAIGELPVYVDDFTQVLYEESEIAGVKVLDAEDITSNCCCSPPVDDTDICYNCREHADFESLPERVYLKI